VVAVPYNREKHHVNHQREDEQKNGKALAKHIKKAQMDTMQVGVKNSKTMMTHFRDRNA